MSVLYFLTIFLFMFVALLLCISILMQESKSQGLGASFGADPTSSVFGTSTADVLKKFTGWMSLLFLSLSVLLSLWTASLAKEESRPAYEVEEIES